MSQYSMFTGHSRRPRNVNLSGQNINPFASTSWSPSASSGVSKSISNAQAERQQRQHERNRLTAAGKIQRIWRGHRARRELRRSRRQAFDALYQHPSSLEVSQRISTAFPLVLSIFNVRRPDDVERLLVYAQDVLSADIEFAVQEQFHTSRLKRFVHILVEAFDKETRGGYVRYQGIKAAVNSSFRDSHQANIELLLHLISRIVTVAPQTISTSLGLYYKILGQFCEERSLSPDHADLVASAVLAPLGPTQNDGMRFPPFARS
jgi:ubiquitin-protein ligase E3 C